MNLCAMNLCAMNLCAMNLCAMNLQSDKRSGGAAVAQRWRDGGACHARLIPVRVHYTLDCLRTGCWETRAEADSERCRDKLKRFRVYGLGFRVWALLTAEERGMSASTGLLA